MGFYSDSRQIDETVEIVTDPSAQVQRDYPSWVAHTTDGQTFYGYGDNNISWILLAERYYSGEIASPIQSLFFRFRDHYELIATHKDAFYFSGAHGGWWGGDAQEFFIGGYLNDDGTFHVKQFSVPELIPQMEEDRSVDRLIQEGIIWKDRSKMWIDPTLASTAQDQLPKETISPSSSVSE